MHQHKENINVMQCVRPEEPKLPAYTVNGMQVANLTAMSPATLPEEQLHLFKILDVYAASHVRLIKRTALCSECQSDRKRMFPLLRILKPSVTPECGVPRYRLFILPLLLSKVYTYKILQSKSF